MELIDGRGILPSVASSQGTSFPQQTLTHPLYRSSSQDDFSTIERNARKKLFGNDDTNYPTLKMEQQRQSPVKTLPVTHKENEKKSPAKQLKQLIEEKLHPNKTVENVQKHAANDRRSASPDGSSKGHKFGIKVLPSGLLGGGSKSPNKSQADNDNNSNQERIIQADTTTATPPPIAKRTKIKVDDKVQDETDLERLGSINSSGIRRDAKGIPQEMPSEMMQAAMAARDHRKPMNTPIDAKKSKGKAPKPPVENEHINDVSEIEVMPAERTIISNSMDEVDTVKILDSASIHLNGIRDISMDSYDHNESDNESSNNSTKIELNSNHITVHQTSEEESENEERRTASLGDLSKLGSMSAFNGDRSRSGTLERAQSLEMTDTGTQLATKVTPKKRKAPLTDLSPLDHKEAKLMNLNQLDSLQRRLKSAYEWGQLEDAIYDKNSSRSDEDQKTDVEETEEEENEKIHKNGGEDHLDLDTSMVRQVIAVADSYQYKDTDVKDINIEDDREPDDHQSTISSPPEPIEKKPIESERSVIVVQDHPKTNGILEKPEKKFERLDMEWSKTMLNDTKLDKPNDSSPSPTAENKSLTGSTEELDDTLIEKAPNNNYLRMSPVFSQHKSEMSIYEDGTTTNHTDEQIKIINYGTNMPDDVKVTRYPFGSLERPKSDVLRKLVSQHSNEEYPKPANSISTTTIVSQDSQPLSLTLGGVPDPEILLDSISISSPISPIFSSDGHGISSINISSSDIPNKITDADAVVTVNADRSQPSSIIMIDDDKLDFTLRTVDDDLLTETGVSSSLPISHKDEVIIIESLSSKKIPDTSLTLLSTPDPKKEESKTFVTEICVLQPNELETASNDPDDQDEPDLNAITPPPNVNNSLINLTSTHTTNSVNTSSSSSNNGSEKQYIEDDYLPRNSEIKFTTSTYESPTNRSIDKEKRYSHIDQIRSNFERNNSSSDIPVPQRKTSAPMIRTSPSKIPVFNSVKTAVNDVALKNNGNVNKVSVSVTSIKNSSRNPSGGSKQM